MWTKNPISSEFYPDKRLENTSLCSQITQSTVIKVKGTNYMRSLSKKINLSSTAGNC